MKLNRITPVIMTVFFLIMSIVASIIEMPEAYKMFYFAGTFFFFAVWLIINAIDDINIDDNE